MGIWNACPKGEAGFHFNLCLTTLRTQPPHSPSHRGKLRPEEAGPALGLPKPRLEAAPSQAAASPSPEQDWLREVPPLFVSPAPQSNGEVSSKLPGLPSPGARSCQNFSRGFLPAARPPCDGHKPGCVGEGTAQWQLTFRALGVDG